MDSKSQEKLEALRKQIDVLDDELIRLLAQRQQLVTQVGDLKSTEEEVEAPERANQVIALARDTAEKYGASPLIVENIFRAMIDSFIGYEKARLKN